MFFQCLPDFFCLLGRNHRQMRSEIRPDLRQCIHKAAVLHISRISQKQIFFISLFCQMSSCQCAGFVMCQIIRIYTRCLPGNHHHRNLQLPYHASPLNSILIHRDKNQSVYPVPSHHIQTFLLMLRIIAGIEKDNAVSCLSGFLFNIFHQICKKCISNIRHYHADQFCPASYKTLRHHVWLKIMLSRACQHLFPDLRIDCFVSIQHTRYRGLRYAS